MKYYLGAALIAMLLTGTANAQHVNIGIKGGVNFYNIHNDNNDIYDTKTGFHLGLIGHIHLCPQFAIQPEIMYSTQGAKYTIDNVETKLKLGYINVPVMLQYMFHKGFRLEAGPQVGFLTSAKAETGSVTTDFKVNLKKVDVAVGMGVGYVSPASGFGIDARYNIGMTNINDNNQTKETNRGFQVGVFYLFHNK